MYTDKGGNIFLMNVLAVIFQS